MEECVAPLAEGSGVECFERGFGAIKKNRKKRWAAPDYGRIKWLWLGVLRLAVVYYPERYDDWV